MTVIFKKSTVSSSAGGLLFCVMLYIYNWIAEDFFKISNFVKALLSMLVNVNGTIGVDLLNSREIFDEGINFSNLFEPDLIMKFSFGELLIYMKIGSLLMMTLTMYIERVFPGQFGIPKP